VISASRMASDAYGLGAANTTTAQLAWAWHRPGSAWTVGASIAYERLAGTEFALISGWMGQATVVAAALTPIDAGGPGQLCQRTGGAAGRLRQPSPGAARGSP